MKLSEDEDVPKPVSKSANKNKKVVKDSGDESHDDIPAPVKKGGKKKKKQESDDEMDEDIPVPVKKGVKKKSKKRDSDDESEDELPAPAKKEANKTKKPQIDTESEEEIPEPVQKGSKKTEQQQIVDQSDQDFQGSVPVKQGNAKGRNPESDDEVNDVSKKESEESGVEEDIDVTTKKSAKAKSKNKGVASQQQESNQAVVNTSTENNGCGDVIESITEKLSETNIGETVNKEPKEKKLTHKDKKKLKKQQEYEKQMETLLKKGGQGHSDLDSNFTVSQAQKTAGQMAALENAVDIKIENFSISAKGNDLFVNATLLIAQGRHYGLVGPNG